MEAIERAGLRPVVVKDDGEAAKIWAAGLRAGPPPMPNLGVIMGENSNFAELTGNLGRNLLEGRVGIFTAVFEVAAGDGNEGDTRDARKHL